MYGARKKNAVGKIAISRTEVLATAVDMPSSRVRPWSTTRAPRKHALEMNSAAPSGPTPGSQASTLIAMGYSGKKAALPSPAA